MEVQLEYGPDTLEFDIGDERNGGVWTSPRGLSSKELLTRLGSALESPLDYPPLRQSLVPGDQVAIALDPDTPEWVSILPRVLNELMTLGIEAGSVRVITTRPLDEAESVQVSEGSLWTTHDPSDRAALAYLATTRSGRRIYLNRHLVDADVVITIGPIAYRFPSGVSLPSDVIDPRMTGRVEPSGRATPGDPDEEVDWLLGSRFQIGAIAGDEGVADIVVGDAAAVRRQGKERLRSLWEFRPRKPGDVVVVGLGRKAQPCTWSDLAVGLNRALGVLGQGGRIAVLSRLSEPPGPTLAAMAESPDPREALAAATSSESDHRVARALMRALERAKVYLAGDLPEELVEGLGMIALGHPLEARRVVSQGGTCVFISRVDWTHVLPVARDEGNVEGT